MVGTTIVKSSCPLEGLDDAGGVAFTLEGVVRGDAVDLTVAILDGVGRLPSLAVATWHGRILAVLLGEVVMLFGVTAFDFWDSPGLDCSLEGWS